MAIKEIDLFPNIDRRINFLLKEKLLEESQRTAFHFSDLTNNRKFVNTVSNETIMMLALCYNTKFLYKFKNAPHAHRFATTFTLKSDDSNDTIIKYPIIYYHIEKAHQLFDTLLYGEI